MQQKYDERQLGKFNRRSNGIKAFKILKVEKGRGDAWDISIRLPKFFGEGKVATFPLLDKFDREQHIQGRYIDVILDYAVYGGVANSYRLTYVGATPPEFIPTDGEEIGNR